MSILARFKNRVSNLLPISERIITIENKTIRRKLNRTAAMASEAYLACELAKMRPIAALPVAVYRKRNGVREEIAHPLATLLKQRWNPHTTAMQGLRWLILRRDTMGTAFVRVEWDGAKPVALWQLNCGVTIKTDGAKPVYDVDGDAFTPRGVYRDFEILVFKSALSDTGIYGKPIAEIAANTLGLSIDLPEYYSRVLENGSHYGGYLETDESLEIPEKEAIAASLKGGSGILQAGKVRIFDKGLKYKQVQQTMADMSIIEQERWVLQRICGVTSVPPQEVFDLSNNTYSNAEQGAINFIQKTIMPEVADLERVFQSVLDNTGRGDCYVKFNVSGMLRGDFLTQMQGYQVGINAGFYTRNEVRAWEDLRPLAGLDRPLQPVNYASIDDDGNAVTAGADNTNQANALQLIAEDTRRRVAARVAKEGDTEGARKYATDAFLPLVNACIMAGVSFDLENEIERLFNAV